MNPDFWSGKRVLVTGHTGFKGSWLTLWLKDLGADIAGFALPPEEKSSLFNLLCLDSMIRHVEGDVRELSAVLDVIKRVRPEIVIHMAAQSLVRRSYEDPITTYSTNVMGTVNILEAIRRTEHVRTAMIVTSDKCYMEDGRTGAYKEDDPIGGFDPYSNSKGCAELVVSAFRQSFFTDRKIAVASARAGNVIGGGDWAKDRLIPDIMRAVLGGRRPLIRAPHAIRPWQHVLNPLSGYILLVERLWRDGAAFAEGWNFGPPASDAKSVAWVADRICALWDGASWDQDAPSHLHESDILMLDSSKALGALGWVPKWGLEDGLKSTVEWYREFAASADIRRLTRDQIARFMSGTR